MVGVDGERVEVALKLVEGQVIIENFHTVLNMMRTH